MRRKFKLKHLVRLIAIMLSLLTVCGCIAIFIVVKVAIDEGRNEFGCFNYCMDELWASHLSGVIIDKNTRKPIVGASVIIADSETQYCPPCEPSETFHLQTDEKGHFRLPHGERNSHRLIIYIEADNCFYYIKEYRAFDLQAPMEDMVGEVFELTCTLPTEQTPEN